MIFRKSMSLVIPVLIAIFASVGLSAAEKTVDHDLYGAARIELVKTLESIPDNMLGNFGFNDREEANKAQLKTVYTEYFLPDGVRTSRVRILVTYNGRACALLGMVKVKGIWKNSDFGASGLAKELGRLEMSRPNGETHGDIMRDLQCKYDYIRYPKERKANELIPLTSVRRAYKNSTGQELNKTIPISRSQFIRSKVLRKFSMENGGEK